MTPRNRKPLAPRPVHPTEASKDDAVEHYGWCTPWCTADGPRDGMTVDEHGPWCESTIAGLLNGLDETASRFQLGLYLAQPYLHGTYLRDDVRRSGASDALGEPAPWLELTLSGEGIDADPGDDAKKVYLSIGDARRLAAMLLRLVDAADGLDIPVAAVPAAQQREFSRG